MEYDAEKDDKETRGALYWVCRAAVYALTFGVLAVGLALLLSEPRPGLGGGEWLCAVLVSKALGFVFVAAFALMIDRL